MNECRELDVREEVSDIIGRELPDAAWSRYFDRAKNKLRYIIGREGDAGGARNTVEYMAELVIEAMRAEILAEMYRGKIEGTGTEAGPQGHTNIIQQIPQTSQEFFIHGGHTNETRIIAAG